ncbi:hypothetical protein DVH24_004807 [Malus domestica]|uniref:Transposase MuDR plant domain-containing protein n=1 Tax=Malus domestica TaxID=3750 RepID=A0A498II43_MALDO|nr:hypothetical protein DVH24_004807 [Malus domestica]
MTKYEDYTSKVTNDYSTDYYGKALDNEDGLSNYYNSDSGHDKVVIRGYTRIAYRGGVEDSQVFNDVKYFWNTLQDYVIQEEFKIIRKKNDRARVTTICKDVGCPWHIHASPTPTTRKLGNRLISYPNKKPDSMKSELKDNYAIQLWGARQKAKMVVEGKHTECYGKLRRYGNKVLKSNPGSIMKIQVDRSLGYPVFKHFLFPLHQPFIEVDGCFLKRPFGGQLFTTVSLDSSSTVFPIVMAVVELECKNS